MTIEPSNHWTKNLKWIKNVVCCRLMPGSNKHPLQILAHLDSSWKYISILVGNLSIDLYRDASPVALPLPHKNQIQWKLINKYITNCRQHCFGRLGLISAVLMLGWRLSYNATPNDPTNVVSSKPCQSAQSSKLVSIRNATVMTHPSRVLNFSMKAKLYTWKSYVYLQTVLFRPSGPHQCGADARMEFKL